MWSEDGFPLSVRVSQILGPKFIIIIIIIIIKKTEENELSVTPIFKVKVKS
jgi:hypothetical protein